MKNEKVKAGVCVAGFLVFVVVLYFIMKATAGSNDKAEETPTPAPTETFNSQVEDVVTPAPTEEFESQVEVEPEVFGFTKDIKASGEKDMLTSKEYKKEYGFKEGNTIRKVIKSAGDIKYNTYDYMKAGEELASSTYSYDNCTEDINGVLEKYTAVYLNCPTVVLGFNGNKVVVASLDDSGVKMKINFFAVFNYDCININTVLEDEYKLKIGDEIRNTVFPSILQKETIDGYTVLYQ